MNPRDFKPQYFRDLAESIRRDNASLYNIEKKLGHSLECYEGYYP